MNDETILDEKKEQPVAMNEGWDMNDETETNAAETEKPSAEGKKKRDYRTAGIAGAAGLAGAAIGVLTPVNVFPVSPEDGNEIDEIGEPEAAPSSSSHLQGHDMPVATGVNDSMSFNQAFAAARQEVGAGGIFVWHGHTYGTYYANEWNAMSPEEHDQYWADVHRTTSNIQYEPTPEPTPDPDPIPTPEPDPDPEPTPTSNPQTLNLNEEDIIEAYDLDGDGQVDAVVVDANGNDIPDVILDTTGDGSFDTLILDVEEDQTGEVVEIDGVNITGTSEPNPVEPVDPVEGNTLVLNESDVYEAADLSGDGQVDTLIVDADGNDSLDLVLDTSGDGHFDTLVIDPGVDEMGNLVIDENNVSNIDDVVIAPENDLANPDTEFIAENDDVDVLADMTSDMDVTIDNNMDMSEFA
ncbi:MAG: hypothetical protein IJ057_08025 [Bacteroidales bacterium]|nr:hypothetical protein [Bacteroidales bacterium]